MAENYHPPDPEGIVALGRGGHRVTPRPILGEEAGDKEWANRDKAVDVFLPTDSYKSFCQPHVLFLFGRRGTGKTSLIHMLRYQIQEARVPQFSCVWVMDQEEAYNQLAIHIQESAFAAATEQQLVHILTRQWEWIFTVSAMQALLWQHQMRTVPASIEREIEVLEKYLSYEDLLVEGDPDLIPGRHPLERLLEVFSEECENLPHEGFKYGAAAARIWKRLRTPAFRKAKVALKHALKQLPGVCLIALDSIDDYSLHDKVSRCVAAAVVQAILQAYNHVERDRILIKAAFPSEIYPQLPVINAEKIYGKCLFIHWKYSDLVSFLARRYKKFLHAHTEGKYLPESLEDFLAARDYLYQFLPATVFTKADFEFDTLAYVIRHSQKKPRQVLTLMNTVLTLVEQLGHALDAPPREVIVTGVHERLDAMVTGALDVMKYSYRGAPEVVTTALTGAACSFEAKELDRKLATVKGVLKENGLDRGDAKQLLLDSGVIGVLARRHELDFENREIWECWFQYQVPRRLVIAADSICVVHPMFYEALHIDVDRKVLVYPVPREDEEREVLADQGITLGTQ